MIIKNIETICPDRVVTTDKWQSCRLITAQDNMGFSFNISVLFSGSSTQIEYKHHLESCYCLEGQGILEDAITGQRFDISPGIIYILDKHDPHIIHAETDLKIACVFNPPLVGTETHRSDGSYAPAASG